MLRGGRGLQVVVLSDGSDAREKFFSKPYGNFGSPTPAEEAGGVPLKKIVACIRAANKILFSGYEADKNRELRWWFGGVVVVALGIRGPDVCTFPEPPVVGKVVQVDTPTNSP